MRSIFASFILSLFFYGLFVYMIDHLDVIDPVKLDFYRQTYHLYTVDEFNAFFSQLKQSGFVSEIINMNSLYAITIIVFLTAASTFTTLHLFLDKLFFRKFYEDPSVTLAVRRGIFFASWAICILYLRIIGIKEISITVAISVLVIIIDIVIVKFLTAKPIKLDDKIPDKPDNNLPIEHENTNVLDPNQSAEKNVNLNKDNNTELSILDEGDVEVD